MEKYGFIYIWYDRKRKMFYVGSHFGTIDDGYICSSNRMRDAYRRRPNDFRRRIIQTNIPRDKLLDEEHKWLSRIKDEELKHRYYNLRKHKWGHWSTDENTRLTVGQKVSKALTGKKHSPERILKKIGRKNSEETKEKRASKLRGLKRSEESKQRMSLAKKGIPMSDDEKIKRSNRMKEIWKMRRGEI